jgi:hypothetical protein
MAWIKCWHGIKTVFPFLKNSKSKKYLKWVEHAHRWYLCKNFISIIYYMPGSCVWIWYKITNENWSSLFYSYVCGVNSVIVSQQCTVFWNPPHVMISKEFICTQANRVYWFTDWLRYMLMLFSFVMRLAQQWNCFPLVGYLLSLLACMKLLLS